MENKTLQRVIFELSGQKNNRGFAKYIRRSESYTSNMINSDKNISVELGIDMMQRMYLDKELIKEVILNYIDEAFFI
jgi:hypothetical protein